MKKKYFILPGLLLVVAIALSGCVSGMNASGWSGVTADANSAYLSGGSYVYAVNLQTGAEQWRFPEKASSSPFDAAAVLTPDGQLIVGGYDKKLYSLNPTTGASNWQFTEAHDHWIGSVLVLDNLIYAPNADYNLYVLNMQGQLQWTFAAQQALWGTPVSDGTNIYFGSLDRKVYAVDAKSGKQVWAHKIDGAILGSPVVGDNNVLYVSSYGGTIYGLNTSDGSTVYSTTASSWVWSGPTLESNTLYFGDGSGDLYAQPINGTDAAWHQNLNGAITGSPLVEGGNVIVGTDSGNVYFVDMSGKNVRPISISGKIYASPVAAGDLILVAPTKGTAAMVALDQTGAVKWSFTPAK